MNVQKLQNELPKLDWIDLSNGECKGSKKLPTSFIKDNTLHVSGEDGDGFVEYYEYFIHPDLEKWAEKKGLYWEWEDAGSIMLCKQ